MDDKEGGLREEEGVDKGGRLIWKRRVGDNKEGEGAGRDEAQSRLEGRKKFEEGRKLSRRGGLREEGWSCRGAVGGEGD